MDHRTHRFCAEKVLLMLAELPTSNWQRCSIPNGYFREVSKLDKSYKGSFQTKMWAPLLKFANNTFVHEPSIGKQSCLKSWSAGLLCSFLPGAKLSIRPFRSKNRILKNKRYAKLKMVQGKHVPLALHTYTDVDPS